MDEKTFGQLEARVRKAVDHIRDLTEKNAQLNEENRHLVERLTDLQNELRKAEKEVSVLQSRDSMLSDRIKEKVEGLVNRINSYEKSLQ
jgi:FtsZ-binding cell division protein ZapB